MKMSELIDHCQKALKAQGDLEVKIADTEENKVGEDSTSELAGIVTIMTDEKTHGYFLICDHSTADMFANEH